MLNPINKNLDRCRNLKAKLLEIGFVQDPKDYWKLNLPNSDFYIWLNVVSKIYWRWKKINDIFDPGLSLEEVLDNLCDEQRELILFNLDLFLG